MKGQERSNGAAMNLRVVWDDYEGSAGQGPERSRNALGSTVLGLIGLGLLLNRDAAAASNTIA